ncbi:sigma-70 family RNA polymerase sigma factor [Fulvivirga ulvae]|uniref:RNA polymerase sigma factor n=1 Tax=Fulvivirga ulvae TaxID=2904245 RepID=UPI001F27D151|nr:sigma-70 family RNA polymerase sigma factor [Fulvivirga ulvae]UII34610.1 sigma-70 family RNA polymerase sigma factor [Fulvivirga ulvae]
MAGHDITYLLKGCINNDRKCQKELYRQLHGFAMGICYRYANDGTCVELINKGFLNLLRSLHTTDISGHTDYLLMVKERFRLILIRVCVDHYHENNRNGHDGSGMIEAYMGKPIEAIRSLSPLHRMVFNLFVIEGYGHVEISKMLGISLSASRDCLSKARGHLKEQLKLNQL